MKKLPATPYEDLTEAEIASAYADFAPIYQLICEASDEGRPLTRVEWDAVQEGLRRLKARDHQRVCKGEIKATDLYAFPAEMARQSRLLLTPGTTTHFKDRK